MKKLPVIILFSVFLINADKVHFDKKLVPCSGKLIINDGNSVVEKKIDVHAYCVITPKFYSIHRLTKDINFTFITIKVNNQSQGMATITIKGIDYKGTMDKDQFSIHGSQQTGKMSLIINKDILLKMSYSTGSQIILKKGSYLNIVPDKGN